MEWKVSLGLDGVEGRVQIDLFRKVYLGLNWFLKNCRFRLGWV